MKTLTPLFVALSLFAAVARADDWPQWQGPARDNISHETGLLKDWSAAKPKLLWTFDKAGAGFSGPAIVGDRLYVMGSRDGRELVLALDLKNGAEIWTSEIGPLYVNGYGDGPRGTPTVDGERLYALGGQGVLVCVETKTGKNLWRKDLNKDLDGKVMTRWGSTESPLIDGDRLICSPGGSKGTLAALDKKSGDVVWRSADLTDEASYSSIIPVDFNGTRQYAQMTKDGLVGVAAKDGKLLWKHKVAINSIAIVPTPIAHDGFVYTTSDYGAGCALVKLTASGSTKVYENKIMENHHGGVVLLDGMLYGCSGNSNGRAQWVCQDFKTGAKKWSDSTFRQAGSLTFADGRLYCYGLEDGTVVLVEPNPTGWKEHGRFTIPQTTKLPRKSGRIWTHPVVANGKLFLRDQELIFCYDVKDGGR
jgi:outer membrane protein assembly factor BamB